MNKGGTLKTCEEKVMGFNDDKDVKGFDCHGVDRWNYAKLVKRYDGSQVDMMCKCTEDKVRREKVFEVDETLDSENSRVFSSLPRRALEGLKSARRRGKHLLAKSRHRSHNISFVV
ncbi:hypothetical protein Tco_0200196 [Tanacetum coccineum]